MSLTDAKAPVPLQPRTTGLGRILRAAQLFAAAAFLFCATFGAAVSRAQDQPTQSVAEAARQARARKQAEASHPEHVYTNEDLERGHILTPEDRAVVEAKKLECAQKNNCAPAPSQNPPAGLDANSRTPANSQTSETSLGEVARRYRKQKELQALKPKQTEPFHLPFSSPALASPVQPERPAIHFLAQPVLSPKISSRVVRRDPFSSVAARSSQPSRVSAGIRRGVSARAHENSPSEIRPEPRREINFEVRSEVRSKIRLAVSPESRSSVYVSSPKNVPPSVRAATRSVLRQDVRPTVRPNMSPEVGSSLRSGFFKNIRPAIPSQVRRSVPAKPRISLRLGVPSLSLGSPEPAVLAKPPQPAAPPELVVPLEPAAPSETLLPSQARHSLPPAALGVPITISVRRGDSLWKLAQQTLGHGNRWPVLLAANPWIANPNHIRTGAQLSLPAGISTPARMSGVRTATVAGGAAVIRVHKGDTLWALAKSTLGSSAYWPCLAAANPGVSDPNLIYQGQRLLMPSVCGSRFPHSGSVLLQSQRHPAF